MDETNDRLKRVAAEFDNYKKRNEKEKVGLYSSVMADVVSNFLPVIDNLEKAVALVKTGLKAYMPEDEYLMLCNRSSNPKKKGLVMANSIGIIDSDYYENPDNDGHFMFAFFNIKAEDIEIKKGDVIGQAIFQKYLTVDNDKAEGERVGGFGSTSK